MKMFDRILKLSFATFKQLFIFPWRGREISQSIVSIGIHSLPIISVSTAFSGLVVTNEIAWHMHEALSNTSMVPGVTGQFILRELGIAVPALLLVSKVGAAMTAEVGTMKITDQVDALKLLKIDPIAYLVFPRWIACILSLACLTLISVAITLGFGVLVAVVKYHFNFYEYIVMVQKFVKPVDVLCALIKSMTFGAVIPLISCSYGFECEGGAQGVGSATTNAVVTSTIAVITLDFLLTFAFTMVL